MCPLADDLLIQSEDLVREDLKDYAHQRLINSVVKIPIDNKFEAFICKNGGLQGSCGAPRQFAGVFD
eukprot:9287235-Pyramimonas_sp.AAC.1